MNIDATPKHVLTMSGRRITAVAYSPDGQYLAGGDDGGNIVIWQSSTLRQLAVLKGHARVVSALAFNPKSSTLVSGSYDGAVICWDLRTQARTTTLAGPSNAMVISLAFSSNGKLLVVAYNHGNVDMWDVESLTKRPVFDETEFAPHNRHPSVNQIAFSFDGTVLGIAVWEGIVIWDIESERIVRVLGGNETAATCFVFEPHGKWIAVGSESLSLWDYTTGVRFDMPSVLHGLPPDAMAVSPDGSVLAIGINKANGQPCRLILWDVEHERTIIDFECHKDNVQQIAFSPDGKALATASLDGTLGLWSTAELAANRAPEFRD